MKDLKHSGVNFPEFLLSGNTFEIPFPGFFLSVCQQACTIWSWTGNIRVTEIPNFFYTHFYISFYKEEHLCHPLLPL